MIKGEHIVTHEHSQGHEKADGSVVVYPYEMFIAGHLIDHGLPPPPPVTQVQGSVRAFINEGRWIVTCPEGCGGAIIPSLQYRVFICPNCGSPLNGGQWYRVVFPPNFRQIELVLLKRPNARGPLFPDHAANRNWEVSQSVADLERENAEHGVT